MEEEKIHEVPLKDIKDPAKTGLNVRLTDRDVAVEDLAKSIKKRGLLQPIVLRGEFGSPPYELIAGHRRLAAHRLIPQKKTIKATFKPVTYSDFKARVDSLVENMQRVELNHADTAEAVTAMYDKYKDERKVADDLGLPLRAVRDYIKIEKQASAYAKGLLRDRKVSKADVKRAIAAAQGNLKKANRLLREMPELYGHEKKRVVEYAKLHPQATVDKIISEAKKARILRTIVLSIEPRIDGALRKAELKLYMDGEEIAYKALEEWLIENGFLARG